MEGEAPESKGGHRLSVSLFTGITRAHWTGLVLVWIAIILLFSLLLATARQTILNEVRSHAKGVAIATAAGIDGDELEPIDGPEDVSSEAFLRIQDRLVRISGLNPDVRYLYIMRRDSRPGAGPLDFEYVIDQAPADANGNGVIDPDEGSEAPGTPYDASEFPAMAEAWSHPSADNQIRPDPPYPDLISGYAPVRNRKGQTVAIVGADVTAATVRAKMMANALVTVVVAGVLCLLVTLVVQLYYQQRDALERNRRLSDELSSRNDMLRAANQELSSRNLQMQQELQLAQHVQLGFLPKTFPRQDRVAFDKFYVTCDLLGGDLFDVFNAGPDHVALYMADVAGHGVSAALISGLLKMAVHSVKERTALGAGHLRAEFSRPDHVLTSLNELLIKEIPDYEFITVIYAVLDLNTNSFVLASAGHPPPFFFQQETGQAYAWKMPTGTALGLVGDQSYTSITRDLAPGDKVLFYTDGLIEAMNGQGEEFGEERALNVLREHGNRTPAEIIQVLREAVERHRGDHEISDDFSLLVCQLE